MPTYFNTNSKGVIILQTRIVLTFKGKEVIMIQGVADNVLVNG